MAVQAKPNPDLALTTLAAELSLARLRTPAMVVLRATHTPMRLFFAERDAARLQRSRKPWPIRVIRKTSK